MQHAITIGDVVKWAMIIGGIGAIFSVIIYVVAAFGRGMSR